VVTTATRFEVWAPGRVNLIGDHTDHTGGLVLPMAIDLGLTLRAVAGGDEVRLSSADQAGEAVVPLAAGDGPAHRPPPTGWARFVAAVVAETRADGAPVAGLRGSITTTLPLGAGLSSSAALEVAVAAALAAAAGAGPVDALRLARRCRRAEERAVGVPCGIMDQLAVAAGVAGHALCIDCTTETWTPVPIGDDLAVFVVDSGVPRRLEATPYARLRDECVAARARLGPLTEATVAEAEALDDPVLVRRARHVITENRRVRDAVAAFAAGDPAEVGRLMDASHASLRDDLEVSVPPLDRLVARLRRVPGVHGARLTGAGFGGSVVVLADAGVDPGALGGRRVRPSAGAHVVALP
jgi:galactokinase